MGKMYKQRVKVGVQEDMTPIYKWACGHSIDEMNDCIVRLYVEHGLIERFMHIERPAPLQRSNVPTFKAYAEKWMKTYKEAILKPTTLKGYRSNLKTHLYPTFGKKPLNEITTDDVQKFLNEREDLAKNTVHTMFVLFSEIMDSAFEDRLIPANPAKSKRLTIVSTKQATRNALSPVQLQQIIADISGKLTDDTERRMMALMLFTGMRRGEVLGLKWEDIDFDNKLIRVRRAVSYPTNQPLVSTPKTRSGNRVIPLDDQLTALLEPKGTTGYVIGGEKPLTQMVLRRILRQINKKVDMFGATPHVFRHSYLSAMVEAGVDPKTVQQIGGHANITTTLNIYVHTRVGLVREAGEKVGRLLTSHHSPAHEAGTQSISS